MNKWARSLAVAAMALLLPAYVQSADIKLGLMCPLTGKWASEGQDMKNIVELLVEKANASGGINGNKIELVVEDDAGDPRTAALAAQKLASAEVVAVIGTYGSAVTEASQNILDESGIVQIGTGSTSVRLTEKGLPLYLPDLSLCGDNAAMIASQGYYEFLAGHTAGMDLNACAQRSIEE